MQFDRGCRMARVGCASEISVSDVFLLFDATLENALAALQPSDGRIPKTPKSAFVNRPHSLLRQLGTIVAYFTLKKKYNKKTT